MLQNFFFQQQIFSFYKQSNLFQILKQNSFFKVLIMRCTFYTKYEIFCKNSPSLKNGIKILVCNFEKIFIKLKNCIPVVTNFEKIFETIKIDFYTF